MKLFKLITVVSIISILGACGRNGPRTHYEGYPKTYPSSSTKEKNQAINNQNQQH